MALVSCTLYAYTQQIPTPPLGCHAVMAAAHKSAYSPKLNLPSRALFPCCRGSALRLGLYCQPVRLYDLRYSAYDNAWAQWVPCGVTSCHLPGVPYFLRKDSAEIYTSLNQTLHTSRSSRLYFAMSRCPRPGTRPLRASCPIVFSCDTSHCSKAPEMNVSSVILYFRR